MNRTSLDQFTHCVSRGGTQDFPRTDSSALPGAPGSEHGLSASLCPGPTLVLLPAGPRLPDRAVSEQNKARPAAQPATELFQLGRSGSGCSCGVDQEIAEA